MPCTLSKKVPPTPRRHFAPPPHHHHHHVQYDKDKISEKVRRELKRVISDPAFTPDQVRMATHPTSTHSLSPRCVHAMARSQLMHCLEG
jgi:hypothetical protein